MSHRGSRFKYQLPLLRDWAAKGVRLLEFLPEQNAQSLGLTGKEVFHIEGVAEAIAGAKQARVRAVAPDGSERRFEVKVRVDTPAEAEYYRHGGILPYVLRQVAGGK